MQILPDRDQGRTLAVGLTAVVAILVYVVCFHWFVTRHVDMSGHIGELERQIGRFKATAQQRPELETRLEELRMMRHDSALFLPESNFNTAAAGLSSRLNEIINAEAEDASRCQVVASQNRRPREPERFTQVTVNVRMECPLQDFHRILYNLENSIPLIFVDNLMINQRSGAYRRGRRGGNPAFLDIRFDMYGYLAEGVAG